MSRTVKSHQLGTRTARLDRLNVSARPYWQDLIPAKLVIGYVRKRAKKNGLSEGTWFLRRYISPKPLKGSPYRVEKLGTADDARDADGREVLNFEQAVRRAHERLDEINRLERDGGGDVGPLTVRKAVADYVQHLRDEGKNADDVERRAAAFILPKLGDSLVDDLTTTQLRNWHRSFVTHGARIRTGKGQRQKHREKPATEDELRARRATANRNWTTLRAALNYAFDEDRASDDRAWRKVKPFENTQAARPGYLTIEEAKRVVNAADRESGFRDLVYAALMTGCRYGELCRLDVRNFNPDTKKLAILKSKSGKARDVVLSDEGIAFFERICAGRDLGEVMLINRGWPGRKDRAVANEFWNRVRAEHTARREQAIASGKPARSVKLAAVESEFEKAGLRVKLADQMVDDKRWHDAEQIRPMVEACKAARITPVGFHQLRHTWASHAVMSGMPLLVVAKNLGHRDTRMVEQHYGHLAEDYVDRTIREHAPKFGLSNDSKVTPLRARKPR